MVEVSILTISVVGASIAAMLLAVGMLVSALRPAHRFWPPGGYDCRWWLYIALSGVATGGLIIVAYLDWNTFVFPRPMTLGVGVGFLGIGVVGFVAATFDLGVEESSGQEGELRTDGFNRYSRNPQIVFLFVILTGIVLVANSLSVLVVTSTMGLWFVLMPFAEEPWLRTQYGKTYENYCTSTPRFIGPVTVRRLASVLRESIADTAHEQ